MGKSLLNKNSAQNRICAVVVWYHPTKKIASNISSYINNVEHVYVIDNSEDKSNHRLVSAYEPSKLTYVWLKRNYGLGYALNKGIRLSIEDNYHWAMTLDQDSACSGNMVDTYKTFINDHQALRVICLSPRYQTDRSSLRPVKDQYCRVALPMQSGCLFQLKLLKQVGDFREEFFIDVIDYDFFCRAHHLKMQIIQCQEAILFHEPATTKISKLVGLFPIAYGVAPPWRYYYQVRNLLRVAIEQKSVKMLLIVIYKYFKVVLFFDHKSQYLQFMTLGIKDALKNNLGELVHE